MDEEWRDVVGYEGLYKVSNLGNVYSYYVNRNLKGGYTLDGYRYVALRKNNVRKNKFVHRLVGIAFIDNPDNLPLINHKDENPRNNCVDNLEWCDYEYNVTYNNAHIKRGDNMGKCVYAYYRNGNLIAKYKSVRDASRIAGVSSGSISECCIGNRPAANNIVWSYEELSIEEIEQKFTLYDKNKIASQNIGEYIKKTKSKPVNQYDLNGNLIKSYPSASEAGRQLGFSPSAISTTCRGEYKQTNGYVFEYA